mmetsp:Transcript_2688/g.6265  ORF Transcript_2688/g.6265 Transcript_2688/m.6265 type:complete len:707 (+) Transcript_2688:160-2280(+)
MTTSTSEQLRFQPYSAVVDPTFWQELARKKLDEWKLDGDKPVDIRAEILFAPSKASFSYTSFSTPASAEGVFRNMSTIEEFRRYDRQDMLEAAERKLWHKLCGGQLGGEGCVFVSFADLKKYHFFYTLGFPYFKSPCELVSREEVADAKVVEQIEQISRAAASGHARLPSSTSSSHPQQDQSVGVGGSGISKGGAATKEVVVTVGTGEASSSSGINARPLSSDGGPCRAFACELGGTTSTTTEKVCVYLDSGENDVYDCGFRNLLTLLWLDNGRQFALEQVATTLAQQSESPPERVVKCYVVQKGARKPKLLRIKFRQPPPQQVVAGEKIEPPQKSFVAGWLKNESGSSVVRHVDLAQWLNPAAIARSAVDLNIKLMKWRLVPQLQPERMQELKFLMLGSGTLGCALARNLLGWGVRHITFLDSGIVNFSNPVRQSLFTHQDAVEQRGKAETAFQRARDVMPELEGAAVRLEIPMPGHPASYNEDSISKLRELVESHDVVCMLTDSRESRWLPSLLVAEAKKPILGLTVALGFDSFVVMTQSCGAAKRACYFCNDVSAPSDSIKERTLDRQCTVVRPGVSGLASSLAAELVAALSQHRQGFEATKQEDQDEVEDSLLGKVPNQIRGYLNDYRLVPIETEPFKHCVCCSEQVREAYRKEPMAFVRKCVEDNRVLEEVSGLNGMKSSVDEMLGENLELQLSKARNIQP